MQGCEIHNLHICDFLNQVLRCYQNYKEKKEAKLWHQ